MALPAIPIALLLKALGVTLTADMVSGILGGPTISSLVGADPEAAMAEREKLQADELMKFRQQEQRAAHRDEVAGSFMPNPNELAMLGSVVQSGMFDNEMSTPQENLLNYTARSLGISRDELARRTRPRSPFQQLRGY